MSQLAELREPHLFEGERPLFDRALRGCRRYLEFGMGGSSLAAARMGIEAIVAVDSDPGWIEAVRRHCEIAPRIADNSMTLLHGEIGPVGRWGYPLDDRCRASWPSHIATAWGEWARRDELPDLVFVDGRFRVACCLSAVLAAGRRRPPGILLHDANDASRGYDELLGFFVVEDAANSLWLLTARDNVPIAAVLARFLTAQFEPR